MINLIKVFVISVALVGCSSSDTYSSPTFETTNEVVRIRGCEELKSRVEEHNRLNPDNQMQALC